MMIMIKKIFHSPIFFSLLAVMIFNSCHHMKRADKIFYNGKIYSVDNNFTMVDAFAILNGRIREIGMKEDILSDYESMEKIDLKGATVFPGFIDAHCHFYGYSTDLLKCDLYGSGSFDDVTNKLIEYAKTNKFSWILGRGWDQNDWENKSWPVKEKLDSLFPNTPVFLMRIDGHAALCNNKALAIAGVTPVMKVEGGEIILANGKMTGLLIDNAVELVKNKIPPFTDALIEKALLQGQKNCFAAGLTTLDDAGLGKDSIFTLLNLQKQGKLKMRIYAMISDDPKSLNYFAKHGPFRNERMNVNAIKVYADGALGSRGACLKKEYSDQKNHFGYMLCSKNHLEHIAEEAMNNGFQLCTHAIGDSANKVVLEVYSNHLSTENHRRWRIEHCQVMEPKDRKKLNDYSIIPSVQPTHATSDMYWAQERLGKDRMPYAYAYEDLREASDGMIAFGTDFPVEDISPINTFYAAVARKDLKGYPKEGFQIENKIKRKEAMKAMTVYAAYANFEEEEKGSLEEGKVADFVILDRDLMKIDEKDIPKTKVLATYVNGEKVFGE
jgi:predicted amidohydrolase YtcJ